MSEQFLTSGQQEFEIPPMVEVSPDDIRVTDIKLGVYTGPEDFDYAMYHSPATGAFYNIRLADQEDKLR